MLWFADQGWEGGGESAAGGEGGGGGMTSFIVRDVGVMWVFRVWWPVVGLR